MRTSRKTDFRSRDIAKNNFSEIDISQDLDLESPSLSSYFLRRKLIITCSLSTVCALLLLEVAPLLPAANNSFCCVCPKIEDV